MRREVHMKALALGLAVVGAAAFGFAGTASATDISNPHVTSELALGCYDIGEYSMHECNEAIEDAYENVYVGAVAGELAALGVTLDMDFSN